MLTSAEQKRLKNLGYSSSLNKLTLNQKKQVLREVPAKKVRIQRILKYMNKTGKSYGQARTAVFNNNNNNNNGKYEKIAAQLLLEIQTLRTELHNKRNIITNLTKYRNGLRKTNTTYKNIVRQFGNKVKIINPGKFVGIPRVQNMNKTLKKLKNEKLEQEKRRERLAVQQRRTAQSERLAVQQRHSIAPPSHLKNFVKNSGVTVKQSTSKTQKKVEVN
jgi:hypothetical protein